MSGTTPDLPASDEVVADVAEAVEPAAAEHALPQPDAAVTDVVDTVDAGAGPPAEDLGLFTPTWYVLLCALPFAAAFLVPTLLIYQQQNAVPPVSAIAAAWTGVGAGWLLWAIGTAFWLLGKVILSTPRSRSPHAWAWWDRTTRAWVLVVLAWGIVASLAVVVVGILIDRLAA
jgi:hypothetical protein